jgi:hypothetical protein
MALAIPLVVVGPAVVWAVLKDRRRKRAGESPRMKREGVA